MGTAKNEERGDSLYQEVNQDEGLQTTNSRPPQLTLKCPPVCLKSISAWKVILFTLTLLTVLIVPISLACCRTQGNVSFKTCSNATPPCNFTSSAEKVQQGDIVDDIISTQQTELQKLEVYFVQLSEPFCRFPFPKHVSSNMKCFIPFKGQYVIDSNLEDGNQIMRICQPAVNKHHYYLQCDDDVIDGCDVICQMNRCSRFGFTVDYAAIILVSIGNSCQTYNGHFEIGGTEYYKTKKKRVIV